MDVLKWVSARNRKFKLALIVIAIYVVGAISPQLGTITDKYGELIFAIAAVAIGGITVEDSAKAWANRAGTVQGAVQTALDEAFVEDKAEVKSS